VKCRAEEQNFNNYIMKAIDQLEKSQYIRKGYDIHLAYTHKIPYDGGFINPSGPPKTMCVAAVAEIIITAINTYVAETNDQSPYSYLPPAEWNSMRPIDIRSHIWVDPRLDSYGTADALVTFGIGKRAKFGELTPGSFINLNRTNKTGHAVVFIAYLDEHGKELTGNPNLDSIAGFKYYSAQNRNTHGLGYGYAFFSNKNGRSYCPALEGGLSPDCGVQYSISQKLLNTGYMTPPKLWDKETRDQNLKEAVAGLYVQTRARGPLLFPGLPSDLSLDDFAKALEGQDTMTLNPLYENDQE
jgi:hypothetical protein